MDPSKADTDLLVARPPLTLAEGSRPSASHLARDGRLAVVVGRLCCGQPAVVSQLRCGVFRALGPERQSRFAFGPCRRIHVREAAAKR